MGRGSPKRLRIRSKRLDQLDETKLALAFWLLAKDTLAEEQPVGAAETPITLPELPPDEDDAEAA